MEKKIRDTKLGKWLEEKSPKVLDIVGDLLPENGVLGIVKNLVSEEEKDEAYYSSMLEAERISQEAVTARWKADMSSANTLAQMIRPVTLIALLGLYATFATVDSVGYVDFEVKPEYIDMLKMLSMTAFGAYFAGRSYEKTKL